MTDDGRARAARLLARSPFAMPRAEALRLIAERHQRLRDGGAALTGATEGRSEPDFAAAEPMPILDRPEDFAAAFWRTRILPGPADAPPQPQPSSPKPPGGRRRGAFEVIDGGAADVDKGI